MKLTDAEREVILRQLRDEALQSLRRHGCTCQPEPRMSLTDAVYGPYDLPMWESEHYDGCAFVRAVHAENPTARTVLMYDPER